MRAAELTLESVCAEALGLSALFTFDQCCAHRLALSTALLLSPNEITNVFAIVGVVATFDLRLDPVVLLVRQRNRLADSRHGSLEIREELLDKAEWLQASRPPVRVSVYSDSFVLVSPDLARLIMCVRSLQFHLLFENCLFRGALAYGDHAEGEKAGLGLSLAAEFPKPRHSKRKSNGPALRYTRTLRFRTMLGPIQIGTYSISMAYESLTPSISCGTGRLATA
jgi:hypothetical protein